MPLKPFAAVPLRRLADLLARAADSGPRGTEPGCAATTGRCYAAPLKPSRPLPSADWPRLKPLAAAQPRPNCAWLRPPGPMCSRILVGCRLCSDAATTGPRYAAAIKPQPHLAPRGAATRGRGAADPFHEEAARSHPWKFDATWTRRGAAVKGSGPDSFWRRGPVSDAGWNSAD